MEHWSMITSRGASASVYCLRPMTARGKQRLYLNIWGIGVESSGLEPVSDWTRKSEETYSKKIAYFTPEGGLTVVSLLPQKCRRRKPRKVDRALIGRLPRFSTTSFPRESYSLTQLQSLSWSSKSVRPVCVDKWGALCGLWISEPQRPPPIRSPNIKDYYAWPGGYCYFKYYILPICWKHLGHRMVYSTRRVSSLAAWMAGWSLPHCWCVVDFWPSEYDITVWRSNINSYW